MNCDDSLVFAMDAEILKSIPYQTSLRVDFTASVCKINKFIFNNKTLPICSLFYVLDLNIVDTEYDWNGDKDSFTVYFLCMFVNWKIKVNILSLICIF